EQSKPWQPVECHADISAEDYLQDVQSLRHHIQRGDIYEVNYCMRFSAKARNIPPPALFKRLSQMVNAPMMGYASWRGTHLICGSPERFLTKQGGVVSAHPIKGTARRSSNPEMDQQIANELRESKKERAENTMIVDLMRNDLSRFAVRGSVRVPEWCEVHTFPTVHHLISTITCEVDESTSWVDMMRCTFPMGSMTGAPKVSAMQIIQRYERQPRSLYSGTLGYLTPSGDFDLNVIIRSIVYQEHDGQLTIDVGGAITDLSDPESEYQECQLKVAAIRRALEQH
ncbi:MAG: anthranilate synthase component I family protein, partial [Flavobacteriales bacterium]